MGYSPFGHKESDTTEHTQDKFKKVWPAACGINPDSEPFQYSFIGMQPHLFVYILFMAAFVLHLLP